MKTKNLLALVSLLIPCSECLHAAPLGTAFTYQGRLNDNGSPANGLYDFRCQLYDAVEFGALVSTTVTNAAVPVSNGLFVVNLDFGSAVFSGQERWLLITVRTNNALNFTALLPRQRVAPAPHAMYATKAGDIQSGAAPTFTGTVNFNPASGPPFTVGNSTKVPNLNADLLDGLDSSAFVLKSGDTMTGSLTVNSNVIAQGVLSSAGSNDSYGVLGLNLNNGGVGVFGGTDFLSTGGDANSVGVQGATTRGTGVKGTSRERDGMIGLKGTTAKSRSTLGGIYAEDTAVNGNGVVAVATNGANAYGVWAIAPQGVAAYLDGNVTITGDLTGVDRIGVDSDSTLGTPHLSLHESQTADYARLQMQAGSQPYWHIAVGGGNDVMNFYNPIAGDVMTLTTNGTLFVNVLTIRGGADLAEPFRLNDETIPAGSVVVIDEAETGQLRLSTRAYDTRVAGVVSGANGVQPGIMLQQEGVNAGGRNVALTGRVYAKATARNGAIHSGDLLTTAGVAGCAMKVTDHTRAQGAILGKAMSSLREGEGMVLVLVTLQ